MGISPTGLVRLRQGTHNNRLENAIRPFVIGRKAWLFADTPAGAHASAALYSIIETAKAAGIEPYRYLRHLFTALPKATSVEHLEALLPWNIDRSSIASIERPRPRSSPAD